MANTIDWGQGAVNNTIDWGKGKTNNTIDWGAIYDDTPTGETNIIGGSSFTNTYSMSFDGVDEYFDLGTASNLEITDDFSISVWIKDSSALNRGIICCGDRSSTSGWMIYRNSSNKAVFSLYTVNNRNAISTTSINTGTWTNIIATFEKNGTANQQVKIYINGTLEGQSGWLSTQTPTYAGTIYKQIGFPYAGTNDFEGLIDEASIYNRLLTSQEISEISATPIDLSSYNPLTWVRMGDGDTWNGSIWTLTDNGSGGNNATSVNMEEADRVTDVPPSVWTNTYSLSYDGIDEYISGGSTFSTLNGATKATWSFWVKPTLGSTMVLSRVSDSTSTSSFVYMFYLFSTGEVGAAIGDTTKRARTGTNLLSNNVWSHVLVCYDGTLANGSKTKIFINGIDSTDSDSTTATSLVNANYPLNIGRRDQTPTYYYNGLMDELAMWSGADLRSESSAIYNSGVPFDLSTYSTVPNHYFRMGDNDTWGGSSWTISDNTGSYNLTSTNMEEADRVTDIP